MLAVALKTVPDAGMLMFVNVPALVMLCWRVTNVSVPVVVKLAE